MPAFLRVGVACLLGGAMTVLSFAQASKNAPQPQRVVFDGVTSMLDQRGQPVPMRVKVANWAISNQRRIDDFPKQGFLIVEVFAGGLTTYIDGKSQRRVDGETFTVPSRSRLAIETEDDTVILQTIEVKIPPR